MGEHRPKRSRRPSIRLKQPNRTAIDTKSIVRLEMLMTDERNRLKRKHAEAGLEALRRRILAASGKLEVWGVLDEDTYETAFGDGLYLHLKGLAFNETDAKSLAASASTSQY